LKQFSLEKDKRVQKSKNEYTRENNRLAAAAKQTGQRRKKARF
jgi:hypothetical protein